MKKTRMQQIELVAGVLVVALLWLMVGVQLGIRHGRWLASHEDRRVFADTSCTDELGTIRLRVTATGYSSTPDQTDDSPFITATGNHVRVGTLAVSRDLLKVLPYGSKVFVVDDTMNERWRNRIDLWYPSRGAAVEWGRQNLMLEVRP